MRRSWSLRRRLVLAALGILGAVGVGVGIPAVVDAATTLTGGSWSVTTTQTGASTSYSYAVAIPAINGGGATLTSMTVTVPPGTTMPASPTVSLVAMTPNGTGAQYSPGLTTSSSGTFDSSTNTVSVTASGSVNANTELLLTISGVTNTTAAGTYQSTIEVLNGSSPVASVVSPPVTFSLSQLANPYWSTSSTVTSATGVTYSYSFTTATASTLSSIVVSVPPGTTGTPTVPTLTNLTGTASAALVTTPSSPNLDTVTVSFSSQAVAAGTVITVSFGGLTNTALNASYGQEIVTENGSSVVGTAALIPEQITQIGLSSLTFSPSSVTAGATNVSYTYNFTTGGAQNSLTGFDLTVPPGTEQTGSSISLSYSITYNNNANTETLPATTVTFSPSSDLISVTFTSEYFQPSSVVQLVLSGFTNTSTAGSYAAWVTTLAGSGYYPSYASGTTAVTAFSSTALNLQSWTTSSSATSATNVTYTFSFAVNASTTFDSVTMTVPSDTGGTPTAASAQPSGIVSKSVTLSSGLVSYTLSSPVTVAKSQTVQIAISGFTNTSSAGSYSSTVTVLDAGTVLASGVTPAVTFSSNVLSSVGWSASPTTAGTAATYTYSLTFPSGGEDAVTGVTMTVPAGTTADATGKVTLGPVTYSPSYLNIAGQAITLVSTPTPELQFTFTSMYFPPGATLSIEVDHVENTSVAGAYTSSISTMSGTQVLATGTSQQVDFSGSALASPSWQPSSNVTSATGVSYTFSFQAPTQLTFDTITMSIPTTTGTGTASLVSSSVGGTLSASSGLLTLTGFSPSPDTVSANTPVTIVVGGLTNTSTSGTYTSSINVSDQGSPQASGTTPGVSFSSTALAALSWRTSSDHTLTPGVTYTFGFTAHSTGNGIGAVTMTVPAGTAGNNLTATASPAVLNGGSISLNTSTNLLTYSVPSGGVYNFPANTAITITVGGLINPPSPGTSTATITTKTAQGAVAESGATNSVTFVGGPLASMTWTTSEPQVQSTNASYTWTFTTDSSSPLTSLQMTVPNGTTAPGGLRVDTATSGALSAGASAVLSGTTVTLSFNSSAVGQGSELTVELDGFTNTGSAGEYTSTITTYDAGSSIDTGTTGVLWFLPIPPLGQFANACPAPPLACALSSTGATQLVLVAVPGGPVASGSVVLSVQSNSTSGYRVQAETSQLRETNGAVLAESPSTGSASLPLDTFGLTASLSGASGSGAALCPPFGSATPYVGLPISSLLSLWRATASTGAAADTVTLTANVQVGILQPAGTYTGTISYSMQPATSSC